MTDIIIGVDLGGTRVRAACLDSQLKMIHREETLTLAHEGLDATLERIKSLIQRIWPTEDGVTVRGIGISAPGPLNPETGVVVAPPNLPGWHNVPLGDILHDAFDVPVFVGNDANVAALAEVARGAAAGYRHVIYITVSTGVGSGIIYDGRLLLGKAGLAAEAGHMMIVVDDERVSSVELEAAGPAMARRAVRRMKAGEMTMLAEMCDYDMDKVDARMIGEAARAGDPVAVEIVRYSGHIVGLGVVTLLHLFNPEIIVIGGGVSNVGNMLFDQIHQSVRVNALDAAYWETLKIVPSKLNEDVSIIGAAVLVVTNGGMRDVNAVLKTLGN